MASRSFIRFVEQELGKFPHIVIYVLLEWVLIIILFLDGFLAFIANEFARFFELKIPCWLCTRFDHVLVHRNRDFYYNESVCEPHKREISYLAYCHNHRKLSDIRKMCEGCLLSFATERELSDGESYKSLVGILHKDLECFVEDGQPIQLSLKDDGFMNVDKRSNQRCSCCGEPLRVKSSSSYAKVKHLESFTRVPTPSLRAYPYSRSKSEEPPFLELPHVPYMELKFMSDNDSDLVEDEVASNGSSQNFKAREDPKTISVPLLAEAEDLIHLNNESSKLTPNFNRGNKFFGIPLTDSGNDSPRWSYRTKKSPLEKTELATEPKEPSLPYEFDDAILSHLKRQVRLDRKSLMDLYMELDEERSASAVAANNAMAMITRLQAEKAAVQMEALQYQRMMEEQAEYDEEALQATNDMLLKREEDLKALEAELEVYRNKFGSLAEEVALKEANSSHGGSSSPTITLNDGEDNLEKGINSNQGVSSQAENGGGRISEPIKDFKAEKTYILGRIKKVETRPPFAENGIYSLQFSSDSVNNVDIVTGKGSEASLPKELSSLTERVKALEASNSVFLEKNSEGTKILTEISQKLETLNLLVMTSA